MRHSLTPGRISLGRPCLGESYDFVDVVDLLDLKRDVAEEDLVGEDADVPDVDLAVVELSLYHLRGGVEGSAAAGVSQQGRVNCPAEIAYLHYALNTLHFTS